VSRDLIPGSAASLIIGALMSKPRATQGGLMWLTFKEQNLVAAALQHLVKAKRVVILGTAEQAQRAGVEFVVDPGTAQHRPDARIYALPGTPMLPPLEGVRREALGVRRSRGSGQFATSRTIPAYRWFLS